MTNQPEGGREIARLRCRERDLAHDADPVRFGNAMLKCEWGAPDCSYAARCLRDGECFVSPPHLVAARMIEKLIPADGRVGVHLAYLRAAAAMLRAGKVFI